jgi:hypothetical protein
MAWRGFRRRLLRWASVFVVGGSVFQLGSCDPTVRSTLLTGLETTTSALTDTIVSAFFISLQDNEQGSASTDLTTT